jgi:hypothetical protein
MAEYPLSGWFQKRHPQICTTFPQAILHTGIGMESIRKIVFVFIELLAIKPEICIKILNC